MRFQVPSPRALVTKVLKSSDPVVCDRFSAAILCAEVRVRLLGSTVDAAKSAAVRVRELLKELSLWCVMFQDWHRRSAENRQQEGVKKESQRRRQGQTTSHTKYQPRGQSRADPKRLEVWLAENADSNGQRRPKTSNGREIQVIPKDVKSEKKKQLESRSRRHNDCSQKCTMLCRESFDSENSFSKSEKGITWYRSDIFNELRAIALKCGALLTDNAWGDECPYRGIPCWQI